MDRGGDLGATRVCTPYCPIFLNFMQSVGNFGKIAFCHPSYGKFWIRPWLDPPMVQDNLCKIFYHLLTQINTSDKNKAWCAMPYIKVHIPIASKSFSFTLLYSPFQTTHETRSFTKFLFNTEFFKYFAKYFIHPCLHK